MRNGRIIFDRRDPEPRGSQRPDRALAAVSRSLDMHFYFPHACVKGGFPHDFRCDLRGKRRAFARALESRFARRPPGDHVPLHVGDIDERIVERRPDMRNAVGSDFFRIFFTAGTFSLPSGRPSVFSSGMPSAPCSAFFSGLPSPPRSPFLSGLPSAPCSPFLSGLPSPLCSSFFSGLPSAPCSAFFSCLPSAPWSAFFSCLCSAPWSAFFSGLPSGLPSVLPSFLLSAIFVIPLIFSTYVFNRYPFDGAFFLPAIVLRGPLRVRALVRVRCPRTGRLFAVPYAAVAADVHEPLDVHADVGAKVSLHRVFAVDDFPDPVEFVLRTVADFFVLVNIRLCAVSSMPTTFRCRKYR